MPLIVGAPPSLRRTSSRIGSGFRAQAYGLPRNDGWGSGACICPAPPAVCPVFRRLSGASRWRNARNPEPMPLIAGRRRRCAGPRAASVLGSGLRPTACPGMTG